MMFDTQLVEFKNLSICESDLVSAFFTTSKGPLDNSQISYVDTADQELLSGLSPMRMLRVVEIGG